MVNSFAQLATHEKKMVICPMDTFRHGHSEKEELVPEHRNEIVMRCGDHRWHILKVWCFHLSIEEIVAHGTRYHRFPMFLEKYVPTREVKHWKKMDEPLQGQVHIHSQIDRLCFPRHNDTSLLALVWSLLQSDPLNCWSQMTSHQLESPTIDPVIVWKHGLWTLNVHVLKF